MDTEVRHTFRRTQEEAVLTGGPADGVRVWVSDRPPVIQVTRPCEVRPPGGGLRADAVYVYRRDGNTPSGAVSYGYDIASP